MAMEQSPPSGAGRVRVTSEIGALRAVICHTPGAELLAVTPVEPGAAISTTTSSIWSRLVASISDSGPCLSRFSAVHELRELLADIVDTPEVRQFLIDRVLQISSSEPLASTIGQLPGPELIGTFIEGREARQGPLGRILNKVGYELPPLPNLFFTRDAAMVVNTGVIIGAMKYAVRWSEELLMKALFLYHPLLGNDGLIYDGSDESRVTSRSRVGT
jgi:arginine deiminase